MTRDRTYTVAGAAGFLRHIQSTRGTSPAELMVTICITTMVLGLSVLGLNETFISTSAMAQGVANDVRLARIAAVTRGAHYRVVLGSNWYRTERLQDSNNDRVWDVDTSVPAQQRELSGGVTLAATTGRSTTTTTGSAGVLEFDTRGMVVAAVGGTVPSMMTVQINGGLAGQAAQGASYLYIWPSGQVQLLHGGEVHP